MCIQYTVKIPKQYAHTIQLAYLVFKSLSAVRKHTCLVPFPTFLLVWTGTGPRSPPHKTCNTHLFGFALAIQIVPFEEKPCSTPSSPPQSPDRPPSSFHSFRVISSDRLPIAFRKLVLGQVSPHKQIHIWERGQLLVLVLLYSLFNVYRLDKKTPRASKPPLV